MPNGPGDNRVLERHEHAASTGRGLGLGPVAGLYVRETQSPGQLALGVLLIGLILSVCLVPIAVHETAAAPMWFAWAIAAGLLVVVVILGRPFFGPGRRWWLYLYESGFATLDHHGRVRDSGRWAEVEQVDWEWSPHEESAGASLVGYRLGTRDGRVVELPITFKNAYEKFPTLAESLDGPVVQPLARRALQLLATGQPLAFGKVTVDRDGITYAKKPTLVWGELTGWKLDDGQLKLERAAGRPKRLVIPMTQVEGGWILTCVLAEHATPL